MAASEFDLIQRFFSTAAVVRDDVPLGVGDDCALLAPPVGRQLAVSMDTLVAGVHFLDDVDPATLGHKALAVNLSDLAAMGAEPAWSTLALTLPRVDETWLRAFCDGFNRLARRHRVQLVGGDTTRGPLSITVQVVGLTAPGRALRRDAARPGDLVGVTGTLGDAGLALRLLQQGQACSSDMRQRLEQPEPRVGAGLALAGLAHAAIDLSDGLVADLGHVCDGSGVGATIELARLPLSAAVGVVVSDDDWELPLAAGDDYELCFTVAESHRDEVERRLLADSCGLSWIGRIDREPGVRWQRPDGSTLQPGAGGYDHFRFD